MATVRPSGTGSVATTKATTRNNGGVVFGLQAQDGSGIITKGLSLNQTADNFGQVIGSKIVANDGTGAATTDRVGLSGVLAGYAPGYNAALSGTWIMRGGNVTQVIGGKVNTTLTSAGKDYNGRLLDNINAISGTFTQGSGGGTINVLARPSTDITPSYTKGASAGDRSRFVAPSGEGDVPSWDEAAVLTRAVPGELTYMFGGALPSGDNYKAKDTFEV